MDREIWLVLSAGTRSIVRGMPKARRRPIYPDALIIQMWLWTVMHDRPMSWACRRLSYKSLFRPRRLPSVSQFCKRLSTPRFELLRRRLHQWLTDHGSTELLCVLDGKTLVVSEYSTDPDARDGMAHGRYRRGYKLHARGTGSGIIHEYKVLPLNEGEPSTARCLLERLPRGCLVLADANYDSRLLYSAVDRRGGRLLTRLKGRAKSRRRLVGMGPARREAMRTWKAKPRWCEARMHQRDDIERTFANLTNFGGGLGPLPAWVRTLPRVQRWVDAKVAIYHARILARRHLGELG